MADELFRQKPVSLNLPGVSGDTGILIGQIYSSACCQAKVIICGIRVAGID